ncbi:hypothetical protein [Nostoc sp.]|uniref:hypothetical protein n=1 Tax=Nostoc sp. TaxID=1180 RepID=UPI002FF77649
MRPADPRLLEEVGDLIYARLIQVLNLYARCDVYTGVAATPQDLQTSGDDRAQSWL